MIASVVSDSDKPFRKSEEKRLNTGALVGGIFGGILILIIIVVIVLRKRILKRRHEESVRVMLKSFNNQYTDAWCGPILHIQK